MSFWSALLIAPVDSWDFPPGGASVVSGLGFGRPNLEFESFLLLVVSASEDSTNRCFFSEKPLFHLQSECPESEDVCVSCSWCFAFKRARLQKPKRKIAKGKPKAKRKAREKRQNQSQNQAKAGANSQEQPLLLLVLQVQGLIDLQSLLPWIAGVFF